MTALRLALPLVSLALSCGPAPVGAFADKPEPAEEMRLTLTGTVRMPDGSPASGATVESTDDPDESPDRRPHRRRRPIPAPGRLRQRRPAARPLGGPEPSGHADHPGGRRPLGDRDSDGADPRAGGRPRGRRPRRRTPRRGRVRRRLGDSGSTSTASPARMARCDCGYRPASDSRNWSPGIRDSGRPRACAAWTLGLPRTGRRSRSSRRRRSGSASSTRRAARSRAWSSASASRAEGSGLGRRRQDRARPRADGRRRHGDRALGPARETEIRQPAIDRPRLEDRWDRPGTDRRSPIGSSRSTPGARCRSRDASSCPRATSAEGLLITGFGFGPKNRGDRPDVRARADGSFTLRIAPEHGYVLGIVDLEWAADPWSGLIVGKATAKPAADRDVRLSRDARDGPRDAGPATRSGRRGLGGRGEQGDVEWVDAGRARSETGWPGSGAG